MIIRAFKNSVGLRMFVIGFLTLAMLIPAWLIENLIQERQQRRDEAVQEVSEKWGGVQTVSGPVLSVPYKTLARTETTDDKGVKHTEIHEIITYTHLLPENLNIKADIVPEVRYRGIYEVILYHSAITVEGVFSFAPFKELNIPAKDILWNDAFLAVGIADVKGIKDIVKVRWNGTELLANPGIPSSDVLDVGITVKPALSQADVDANTQYSVALDLNLNGSSELYFVPVGRETKTTVRSKWGNPSFVGQFLPENRTVEASTFSADWKILHLNRNFPQAWRGAQYKIQQSAFGVKLLMAIDEYQKITRTAKYAIMFITLTFLSFFMAEVLTKRVIHPIQYVLIGLALSIFYTLLLSLSEQINFNRAYVLSSAAIIVLIAAYTRNVLGGNLATAVITGILVTLYGFLYIVLQLQDYALLLGSVGLFVILAVVMYITRKIDWFSLGGSGEDAVP